MKIENCIKRKTNMPLFNWNAQYSVNVKEIDEQHKKLVDIINELHDSMKVGKGKETLGTILNELVDYTIKHFSYEENLFSSKGYPESKDHKNVHAKLVNQVKALKSDFESGKAVMTMDVMNFLKDWLSEHIMGTDKKYSSFLNAQGIF